MGDLEGAFRWVEVSWLKSESKIKLRLGTKDRKLPYALLAQQPPKRPSRIKKKELLSNCHHAVTLHGLYLPCRGCLSILLYVFGATVSAARNVHLIAELYDIVRFFYHWYSHLRVAMLKNQN